MNKKLTFTVFFLLANLLFVQIAWADLAYISKYGRSGSGDGNFRDPYQMVIDKQDNLYVSDYGNYRIQKFDSQRQFLTKIGSYGSDTGQFKAPTGIAVDSNGFIYVADEENHCIQKFSSDGQCVLKWGRYGEFRGRIKKTPRISRRHRM